MFCPLYGYGGEKMDSAQFKIDLREMWNYCSGWVKVSIMALEVQKPYLGKN